MKNPFKREKKTEEPKGRYVRLPDGFPEEVTDEAVLDLFNIGTEAYLRAFDSSPADSVVVQFRFPPEGAWAYRVLPVDAEFAQVRP